VIPFSVLAIGTIYACENCTPPERALSKDIHHNWTGYSMDFLLLVKGITGISFIRWATPFRLIAIPLPLLLLWRSFWAALIAAMSISGDWL
jgi:hypothetical protein